MERTFGAQSMVGRMTRVVVKRPAEAFVSAEKIEREWQRLGFTASPDLKKAEEEFALEEVFSFSVIKVTPNISAATHINELAVELFSFLRNYLIKRRHENETKRKNRCKERIYTEPGG